MTEDQFLCLFQKMEAMGRQLQQLRLDLQSPRISDSGEMTDEIIAHEMHSFKLYQATMKGFRS